MDREHKRFEGSQGITLAADCYGNPKDPPAVLFHGGGQTRHSWSGTAVRLAEEGWYAVTVDLRGHGESDWDPSGTYHYESFRNDAIQVARAFDTPPVLIGASLAGSHLCSLSRMAEMSLLGHSYWLTSPRAWKQPERVGSWNS